MLDLGYGKVYNQSRRHPIIRAVTYLAPYPDQAVLQGGSKLAG